MLNAVTKVKRKDNSSIIYISPYVMNQLVLKNNSLLFREVCGHELIHSYHVYKLGLSFKRTYSEMVAYQYSINLYIRNGYTIYAHFTLMRLAAKFGFLGNYPNSYALPKGIFKFNN